MSYSIIRWVNGGMERMLDDAAQNMLSADIEILEEDLGMKKRPCLLLREREARIIRKLRRMGTGVKVLNRHNLLLANHWMAKIQ